MGRPLKTSVTVKPKLENRHPDAVDWISTSWAYPPTDMESKPVQVTTVSGAIVLARWSGLVWVEEATKVALPGIRFWRVAR